MAPAVPRFVFAATIVLLSAVSGAAGGIAARAPDLPCPAETTPHPPIRIEGDAGFLLPGSGVVGGTGTSADPFRIEGWDITPQGVDGIFVSGTTAHVVIRANCIHDAVLGFQGYSPDLGLDERIHSAIYAYDAEHVRIESNLLLRNAAAVTVTFCECFLIPGTDGVTVEFSADVEVRGNTILRSSAAGIRARESSGVSILENTVHGNGQYGIVVYGIPDVVVSGNDVRGHDRGSGGVVVVTASPRAGLVGNTVAENEKPIAVAISTGTTDATVSGNTIRDAP
ncbi:MAG: right-handed parallel beta-helix repeat-containing protein [Methanobacteriota archaeon]